jgi:DNA-binding transcriptional regulator YiaG
LQGFGSVSVRMYANDHRPPHFSHCGARFSGARAHCGFGRDRGRGPSDALTWARVHQEALALVWGATQRARLTVPRRNLPRIAAVSADKPFTLRVRWDKADEGIVDVSGPIATFRVYEPLRHSPELFAQVRRGEHGTDVVWNDEIDMSADTLWRLAQEQTGITMSPDAFKLWRERKAYTLDAAARALGLSRRMVAYYEQGVKPIPRVVALATLGLDHV